MALKTQSLSFIIMISIGSWWISLLKIVWFELWEYKNIGPQNWNLVDEFNAWGHYFDGVRDPTGSKIVLADTTSFFTTLYYSVVVVEVFTIHTFWYLGFNSTVISFHLDLIYESHSYYLTSNQKIWEQLRKVIQQFEHIYFFININLSRN